MDLVKALAGSHHLLHSPNNKIKVRIKVRIKVKVKVKPKKLMMFLLCRFLQVIPENPLSKRKNV